MRRDKVNLAAIGGLVGGLAMGMWMMIYYWASGRGFWEPVGYIGHFFLREEPVTQPLQVAIGLLMHMSVSVALGVAIGLALPRAAGLTAVIASMFVGLAVWAVMQNVVLVTFDEVAYRGLIPWAFAVGHLIYGAFVGLAVGVPWRRVTSRTPTARRTPIRV